MRHIHWWGLLASAASCPVALAATPDEFLGDWKVSRMVGAANVHSGADNPTTPLHTVVRWTKTEVEDIDGICTIVRPTLRMVTRDGLQHDVWGGQSVGGLMLPKAVVAATFKTTETSVFDDGDVRCSQAVMLSSKQMLLMFDNGYLYVLDREPTTQLPGR